MGKGYLDICFGEPGFSYLKPMQAIIWVVRSPGGLGG